MITRKERISLLEKERTMQKMKCSNANLKRGTALFSTSLLVGLLAFPTYTETVEATELDKDQLVSNEAEKDIEVVEGETVAVETEANDELEDGNNDNLSEEKEIEKEQKIKEFKKLVSQEIFDAITFEGLSLEDVDQLIDNALLSAEESGTLEIETEVAIETELATEEETILEEVATEVQVETSEAVEETETAVEVVESSASTFEAELVEENSGTEEANEIEETEEMAETAETEAVSEVIEEVEEEKIPTEVIEDSAIEEAVEIEETVSEEQVVEVEAQVEASKATTMMATTSAPITKETKTTAVTTKNAEPIIYVVKSGDTLNKIAANYGVSVNDLMTWNNISNKNVIKVGQQLSVNQQAPKKEELEEISKSQTPEQFIASVGAFASEVAAKNNLYASVMIAQAGLESGWGSSSLSKAPNNNLFGIKGSYNGESVTMYTKEYSTAGGWINIPQNFKKYPSYAESFQDNANLLKKGTSWDPNFYAGAWVSNTSNVYEATAWLEGRYATDPTYAAKLNNLIKLYNLTRFDVTSSDSNGNTGDNGNTGGTPSTPVTPNPSENDNSNTGTGNTSQYTIQSGDTLTSIAKRYNTTVANLKSLNNLKSDTIYVGQKLTVNGTVQEESKPSTGDNSNSGNTESSTTQYTVQSGDTLTGIARKYNTTVANLKSLNSLKSDTIY
ncbi:LysM peptidoglycan-binding domain-containing protein, partial [Desemzia sp. RIT 804]|uniref:muramidase family protein n=1 Tax=Desemzia sp. RIT 804 TaxID=2810209 RepID=UPI00351CA872